MNEIDHAQLFFKPGVSPTSVNQFFDKPAEFWKFSSLNPKKERKDATPEMIFGRLTHCLVLTPEDYDKEFVEAPEKKDELDTAEELKEFITARLGPNEKIASKAKKSDLILLAKQLAPGVPIWQETLDNFKRTVGRKSVVTAEQVKNARSMQEAMLRNNAVRSLIGNGHSEEPYCWFPDGPDGLMRKVKLDYHRQGLIIEYKTALKPDPESFQREIGDRGYHRQLAMQFDASTRRYGEAPRGAIIIAQDKEYHDDIAINAVHANALTVGAEEVEFAMRQIAERIKSGNWKKFPERITPIGLAPWYKPKHIERPAT